MRRIIFAATTLLAITASLAAADSIDSYIQTNLVSDLPGIAANQDQNLVNPWGIVAGPTTPFWISDNHSGLASLYNGAGITQSLVVTIPPPAGSPPPAAPTGVVFNSSAAFGGSRFIFATEDGTIAAWSAGTSAALEVTSPDGSVYKGLAIGNSLLYATNFGLGQIDVFDSNFHSVALPGGFHDNNLPTGYAPFNIQNIDGKLYVTYALQDAAKHDDVAGAGNGFIDVFDLNGNLLQRLTSRGALNSPWGLALAPSQFGALSGDLLAGNFGDGTINAYNPNTGAFIGTVDGPNGTPIVIPGLWGLDFGNGVSGQGLDTLYFTAGIPGSGQVEDHGLFGSLDTVPEPRSVLLTGSALLASALWFLVRRRRPSAS